MPYRDVDPEDNDAPQECDLDWDEENDYTVDCPYCRRPIHEEAIRCPHCGQFVIHDSPAARRSQGWFWPFMVVLLVLVILVMWHGLGR